MSDALVGAYIAAAVALVAALLGFVANARSNRNAETGANIALNRYIDERVNTLVDERISDVRDELREVKRNERIRTNAFIRILHSIARQWPSDRALPLLDPADIKAVEDTIPPEWLPGRPT